MRRDEFDPSGLEICQTYAGFYIDQQFGVAVVADEFDDVFEGRKLGQNGDGFLRSCRSWGAVGRAAWGHGAAHSGGSAALRRRGRAATTGWWWARRYWLGLKLADKFLGRR